MTQQIILNGDFGFDITLANIMGAVKLYPNDEIELIVSSCGGYVDEAKRIYDYLATQQNVSVIFKDICASATTFAFLSLPADKRKCYANTQFAIHLPLFVYFTEEMNTKNLETDVEALKLVENEIYALYEKHLNITHEELLSLISPDSWFNEIAAKGFNIVSEILTQPQSEGQIYIFDMVSAKSKIAAYIPKKINNQINTDMTELTELKNEVSMFKQILDKVANILFPSKAKALILSTEEGQEVEVDGETLKEGATVTNDCPDGTYTCMYNEKKYKVVVTGKKIETMTEVVEPPAENEIDILRAENERLKAENLLKDTELNSIKTDFDSVKENLTKIKSKVFNPDTKEFNFTGTFQQETTPESNESKIAKARAEVEAKKKELRDKNKTKN